MSLATSTLRHGAEKRPPGPPGHWFTGHIGDFRGDRLDFLTRCARNYGDVVSLRLGPARIYVLNHPELVEEVLVRQNRIFVKHFALRAAKPTLGEGLLTSEGEFWRRQRRLAQPAFHRERIAAYAKVMVEYTERMLTGWSEGQRRDVQADMMGLTLEIVAKTLFDAEIDRESGELTNAMETLMTSFTDRVNRLIPQPNWLPVPQNFRYWSAMGQVERLLKGIIAERRRTGEDRGDLLSMLLHAQDVEGDGGRMTDKQLQDEVVTLFLAGHETTANTLAWAWLLLSRNPDAEARLSAELDEVLGVSERGQAPPQTDGARPLSETRAPTFEDLPRLTYADAVITETLRVMPTVWLLGREATVSTEIGGYAVPKGTTLWMSQWVIHRDPRWFEEPEAFRPERWLDGLAKRLPRYAYFPYGGGPRICIGNAFAQMEAVLLLATIARRFRPRVPDDVVVGNVPTMTLRPTGVPVVIEGRLG